MRGLKIDKERDSMEQVLLTRLNTIKQNSTGIKSGFVNDLYRTLFKGKVYIIRMYCGGRRLIEKRVKADHGWVFHVNGEDYIIDHDAVISNESKKLPELEYVQGFCLPLNRNFDQTTIMRLCDNDEEKMLTLNARLLKGLNDGEFLIKTTMSDDFIKNMNRMMTSGWISMLLSGLSVAGIAYIIYAGGMF